MRSHSAVVAASLFAANLFLGLSAPARAADAAAINVTQSGFSPLYLGVDYETATIPANPATATATATSSRAYVTRVDLKAPGIGLVMTGHSGTLDTTAETVSQFAIRTRTRIAINTSFFAPCCDHFVEPKTTIGLLVSNGQVVSPNDPSTSPAVFAILKNGKAVIEAATDINVAQVQNGVAGSNLLVLGGQDVSSGPATDNQPRTVFGLSKNGRYLYLAVIDGRETGYSIGATMAQSAALMLAVGADSALNLDGGGSSEMVRADTLGQPYILNDPSDQEERFDAAALGIFALPLPALPFE